MQNSNIKNKDPENLLCFFFKQSLEALQIDFLFARENKTQQAFLMQDQVLTNLA